MTPRHRLQSYYGYAFESYCTSSTAERRDERSSRWGGDVNTNVQWCGVVKTKLGNRRIIMGGEVDCVRGKYHHDAAASCSPACPQPIVLEVRAALSSLRRRSRFGTAETKSGLISA